MSANVCFGNIGKRRARQMRNTYAEIVIVSTETANSVVKRDNEVDMINGGSNYDNKAQTRAQTEINEKALHDGRETAPMFDNTLIIVR